MSSTIVLLKKWLKDNDIEMYLTLNEGKPVVLLKDLLELYKAKFTNTWQLYQKMCILTN